jgi:hypothetical protein
MGGAKMRAVGLAAVVSILLASVCSASNDYAPTKKQDRAAICLNALVDFFKSQDMLDTWGPGLIDHDYWIGRKAIAETYVRRYCPEVRGAVY